MTVLLFATTIGDRLVPFEQAAATIGIDLERVIAVPFADEPASVADVCAAVRDRSISGLLAVDDGATVLAARVARELQLPWHTVDGVRASRSPLLTRGRLMAAGLPVPWFFSMPLDAAAANVSIAQIAGRLRFPCVVKLPGLSALSDLAALQPLSAPGRAGASGPSAEPAHRGVMRADSVEEFELALDRLRARLAQPAIRARREAAVDEVLVEGFIAGREYALQGLLDRGALHVLAIVERPGALGGPSDPETGGDTTMHAPRTTPAGLDDAGAREIAGVVAHGAARLGLRHGPLHAECRVNEAGVFVLAMAAHPVGGAEARALRFATAAREGIALAELLLRHAVGESLDGYGREAPPE